MNKRLDLRRGSTQSTVLAALLNVGAGAAIAAIAGILIGRWLGIEQYGEVGHQLAYATVVSSLTMLGFNGFITRQAAISEPSNAQFRYQVGFAFKVVTAVSLLAALITIGATIAFDIQDTSKAVMAGALVLLYALSGVATSLLIGLGRPGHGLAVGWMTPLVWILLIVILHFGFGTANAATTLFAAAIASLLSLLVMGWWCRQALGRQNLVNADKRTEQKRLSVIKLAFPFLIIAFLDVGQTNLPTLIVTALAGYQETGIFLVSMQVAGVIALPVGAIAWGVTSPIGQRIHSFDAQGARLLFRRSRKWSAGFGVVTALIVLVLSPHLMSYLGVVASLAFLPVLVLVGGQLVNAFTGPNIAFNLLLFKQRTVVWWLASSLALSLLLIFGLTASLGAAGGAIGVAAFLTVSGLGLTYSIRGDLPLIAVNDLVKETSSVG